MSKQLCARCGHPSDWHRHDDEGCIKNNHPQPCSPEIAPFRCIGYDCEVGGKPPKNPCGCPDFVTDAEVGMHEKKWGY